MKKLVSFLLAAVLICSLFSTVLAESEVPFQLENGGFETGDFTGWTLLNRGQRVGIVTGMEPIPGNLCLYVRPAQPPGDTSDEVLVPLHPDLVLSVDAERQHLDLDLPAGLL